MSKERDQQRVRNKTNSNKKKMIEALEKTMGIVTNAAKAAGISRIQHYKWMKVDAKYREQVDAVQDIALDFVESKLMNNINNGSDTAAIFYLKTKGKKRGYIEQQNFEHKITEMPHSTYIVLDDKEEHGGNV